MRSQIKLGQIFGIKIGLHYSWLLIAFLITFSLTENYHGQHPQWGYALIISLAIVTSLLFFCSLLLHELAHSVVARTRGVPVSGITLFALGGVSQLGKEASTARDEFLIAIVGPATSALIGLVCLGAAFPLPPGSHVLAPVRLMLQWLGYINFGLCAFNLIPGYPMDGGRILRAIIWWKTNNMDRATINAARVGQVIATLFILIGIFSYFHTGNIGSLWIALIGWFLLQAARESIFQLLIQKSLTEHSASEFMSHDFPQVDKNESIRDFVDHTLLPAGARSAIVTENAIPVGFITIKAIKRVDRNKWPSLSLSHIMRPLSADSSITPETSMLAAVQAMDAKSLELLPVIANGKMKGVVSRDSLLSRIRTLIELQDL